MKSDRTKWVLKYLPVRAHVVLAACLSMPAVLNAQTVAHTVPSNFHHLVSVHDGAGTMDFGPLLGADALDTNLLFLHRGVIQPHSGIGAHFHNRCEEMFVILDGEAQFTVDGRTTLLPLDPTPTFITMHLDKSLLKPVDKMNGGTGTVRYRRVLDPSIFYTAWSYVDHLMIPPGSSVGPDSTPDMSSFFYVLAGAGEVSVDGKTAPIVVGDAVPVKLGQTKSIANHGSEPLELMIVGVARDLKAKEDYIAATSHVRR